MHASRAIVIADRFSLRQWLGIGIAGIAASLSLTFVAAATAADVALVGIALGIGAATGWVARARWQLDHLPLEIAPVAGVGRVDGADVVRFRARLGHGRPIRDVTAQVWRDGDSEPLAAFVPPGVLCGPFTVVARLDGTDRKASLRLEVAGTARGQRWTASMRFDPDAVRDGRFGGITASGGRLAFEPDWAGLVPSA